MTRLAIAIDKKRCIGCSTCTLACKMQNNVPDGMLWNRVINEHSTLYDGVEGEYPQVRRNHLPLACQHCENAACLRVCPTGATYRDDKGRVEINYDRCIGCRMCMAACPYSARSFNWADPKRSTLGDFGDSRVVARRRGVIEKCTLCKERTDSGQVPMCVHCCPADARVYGDLDDPSSPISKKIASSKSYMLREDFGTKPQVRYCN